MLELPVFLQLRPCGHYAAATPDDHETTAGIVALNRSLDAALGRGRRRRPTPRPKPGRIPAWEHP